MRNTKQTRNDVYRGIMEKYGKKGDEWHVLAFVFESEYGPEFFHYQLMYPLRPVYHFFDCFDNVAQVIVPNDPENDKMCIALAESCGGEKTTPNLR